MNKNDFERIYQKSLKEREEISFNTTDEISFDTYRKIAARLSDDLDQLFNLYFKLAWINCDFEPIPLQENNNDTLEKIAILTKRVQKDINDLMTWTAKTPQLTEKQLEEYNKNLIDMAETFLYIGGRITTLKNQNRYYTDVYPDYLQLKSQIDKFNSLLILNKKKGIISFVRAKEISAQRIAALGDQE